MCALCIVLIVNKYVAKLNQPILYSFDNICDNIIAVEEIFKLENIDEFQTYAVIFDGTRRQEQCSRTAKRLNRLPQQLIDQDINGTVRSENCMETEKFIAATLNLNGLEWVRTSSTNHYDIYSMATVTITSYV